MLCNLSAHCKANIPYGLASMRKKSFQQLKNWVLDWLHSAHWAKDFLQERLMKAQSFRKVILEILCQDLLKRREKQILLCLIYLMNLLKEKMLHLLKLLWLGC